MSLNYPDPMVTSINVYNELPFNLKQILTADLVHTIMEIEHNLTVDICENRKYNQFIMCPVTYDNNALILPKLKTEVSNLGISIGEPELIDLVLRWKRMQYDNDFDLFDDFLEDDSFKTNFEQWLN